MVKKDQEDLAKDNTVGTPSFTDEKPFDYGGLPERDLKKNLGCGG